MDLEKIASAHDADLMIIYTMIDAMLATHPNPTAVMAELRAKVDSLLRNAPKDTPEEHLVELRARISQNLIAWDRTTAASGAR